MNGQDLCPNYSNPYNPTKGSAQPQQKAAASTAKSKAKSTINWTNVLNPLDVYESCRESLRSGLCSYKAFETQIKEETERLKRRMAWSSTSKDKRKTIQQRTSEAFQLMGKLWEFAVSMDPHLQPPTSSLSQPETDKKILEVKRVKLEAIEWKDRHSLLTQAAKKLTEKRRKNF